MQSTTATASTFSLWSSTCTHSLTTIIIYNRGCAWLKQLLASIPLEEAQVRAQTSPMGFVVNKVAGDRFLSDHVGLPLPISLHQRSILILITRCYTILATDGAVTQTNTYSQYDRNVPSRVTTKPVQGSHECKGVFQSVHAFEISSRRHGTVRPSTTAI